jgi:hypothetical protein
MNKNFVLGSVVRRVGIRTAGVNMCIIGWSESHALCAWQDPRSAGAKTEYIPLDDLELAYAKERQAATIPQMSVREVVDTICRIDAAWLSAPGSGTEDRAKFFENHPEFPKLFAGAPVQQNPEPKLSGNASIKRNLLSDAIGTFSNEPADVRLNRTHLAEYLLAHPNLQQIFVDGAPVLQPDKPAFNLDDRLALLHSIEKEYDAERRSPSGSAYTYIGFLARHPKFVEVCGKPSDLPALKSERLPQKVSLTAAAPAYALNDNMEIEAGFRLAQCLQEAATRDLDRATALAIAASVVTNPIFKSTFVLLLGAESSKQAQHDLGVKLFQAYLHDSIDVGCRGFSVVFDNDPEITALFNSRAVLPPNANTPQERAEKIMRAISKWNAPGLPTSNQSLAEYLATDPGVISAFYIPDPSAPKPQHERIAGMIDLTKLAEIFEAISIVQGGKSAKVLAEALVWDKRTLEEITEGQLSIKKPMLPLHGIRYAALAEAFKDWKPTLGGFAAYAADHPKILALFADAEEKEILGGTMQATPQVAGNDYEARVKMFEQVLADWLSSPSHNKREFLTQHSKAIKLLMPVVVRVPAEAKLFSHAQIFNRIFGRLQTFRSENDCGALSNRVTAGLLDDPKIREVLRLGYNQPGKEGKLIGLEVSLEEQLGKVREELKAVSAEYLKTCQEKHALSAHSRSVEECLKVCNDTKIALQAEIQKLQGFKSRITLALQDIPKISADSLEACKKAFAQKLFAALRSNWTDAGVKKSGEERLVRTYAWRICKYIASRSRVITQDPKGIFLLDGKAAESGTPNNAGCCTTQPDSCPDSYYAEAKAAILAGAVQVLGTAQAIAGCLDNATELKAAREMAGLTLDEYNRIAGEVLSKCGYRKEESKITIAAAPECCDGPRLKSEIFRMISDWDVFKNSDFVEVDTFASQLAQAICSYGYHRSPNPDWATPLSDGKYEGIRTWKGLAEWAWTILCNVKNWKGESADWQGAARVYGDLLHSKTISVDGLKELVDEKSFAGRVDHIVCTKNLFQFSGSASTYRDSETLAAHLRQAGYRKVV